MIQFCVISAIQIASSKGLKNVVEVLLTHSAGTVLEHNIRSSLPDTSIRDADLRTPLHCASHAGHADVVHMLVQARADVRLQDSDGTVMNIM